jgi:hypothetical protein
MQAAAARMRSPDLGLIELLGGIGRTRLPVSESASILGLARLRGQGRESKGGSLRVGAATLVPSLTAVSLYMNVGEA